MPPAAVELARRAMAAICARTQAMAEYAAPMGALALRFSGTRVAHVGKTVDAALERVLATAMATTPVTYRGYVTKGAKRTRYAAPKRMDGAGRKVLAGALATLRAMPREATMVYVKDGVPDSLVPDRFAAYVSLAADAGNTFATGRGFLMVGFPLDTLGDPRWIALGDELVALLGAEVAWLGPAIWLAPHCLFNGAMNNLDVPETLIALFGTDPQLDVPSYVASRWPFAYDELLPGPLEGFLQPSWVMWAAPALAKRVTRYRGTRVAGKHATRFHASERPPFEMTEDTYAAWKQAWADLAPLHVRVEPENENEISQYYGTRFAAPTYAALRATWQEARAAEVAATERTAEISREIQKLAQKPTKKLVDYAASVAKQLDGHNLWYLLPGLTELVKADKLSAADALVWLDLAEQVGDTNILVKSSALALAADDTARALDLLRRAKQAGQLGSLKSHPDFRRVRRDPRFAKLIS